MINQNNAVMETYSRFPITLTKGDGMYVYDENGKKYLDFVAGIATNSLGHGNKKLCETIAKQAQDLIHVSNLYWTKPQLNLAEKLVKNSCFDRVFFCNSGAESIEGALKLARKYAAKKESGRFEIIAMNNSFHGRTFGAITATGQKKYQKGLDPLLPGITHVDYNDFDALKAAVNDKTCAVLMELIQGEGGIVSADKEYVQKVRELCTENGILLIFDEIQTGVGRTGYLFAHEYFGVYPDIMTLAKGLAGGVPIGALLATEEAASGFAPGDHAATFGGNPLATSAACVVLEELIDNGLLKNVKVQGEYLRSKLNELKAQYDCIKDIRGIGLIQGIAISLPVSELVKACIEGGLLLVGARADVVRFVPSLIVTEKEIDEMVVILKNALDKCLVKS